MAFGAVFMRAVLSIPVTHILCEESVYLKSSYLYDERGGDINPSSAFPTPATVSSGYKTTDQRLAFID
jgi:hypothetical protein